MFKIQNKKHPSIGTVSFVSDFDIRASDFPPWGAEGIEKVRGDKGKKVNFHCYPGLTEDKKKIILITAKAKVENECNILLVKNG